MSRNNPSPIKIYPATRGDPRLEELLKIHAEYCAQHTPAGSGHAIAPGVIHVASVWFWLAFLGSKPVGSIGLSALDDGHGEIKSLHVLAAARRYGLGKMLLVWTLDEAARLGMSKVSLETGKGDGFSASRKLYRKRGFSDCKPFGNYRADPFSHCMTISL